MATQHVQCQSQFDLMMQLAQKGDSAAKVFDTTHNPPTRVARNNFLDDQVNVTADDVALGTPESRRNPLRESVTESKSANATAQAPLKVGHSPAQNFVKERLKGCQKIWMAMTKFIASQCATGRTVDLPLAGKFKRQATDDDGNQKPVYMFMPHLDFVGSGHFKFAENDANVSPFSKASAGFQSKLVTVSLTSLGAVCSLDRESVATVLKAIFVKFVSPIMLSCMQDEVLIACSLCSCRSSLDAMESTQSWTCGSAS